MNSHLVTVEVSVKCSTHQWVNLQSLAFNKHWFECLDTKAVQSWSTVQQNWVFLNDIFKNVPHLWATTLHHALCALDVLCKFEIDQTLHDERLEKFECHQLGQTTLVQTQGGAGHNY